MHKRRPVALATSGQAEDQSALGDEIRFYERYLGRTLTCLAAPGGPRLEQGAGPAWNGRILQAHLLLGAARVADDHGEPPQLPRGSACFSLTVRDPDDAEQVYRQLADGGERLMPMTGTCFARGVAMLQDCFGTWWMLFCPHG